MEIVEAFVGQAVDLPTYKAMLEAIRG